MPFYKKDADELLVAPNFVHGPGFSLMAEEKDSYTYPVEGWYWYDDIDSAIAHFAGKNQSVAVSARQIRQAMNRIPHGAGTLRDAIETVVAAGDRDLKDWWNFSVEFVKTHPQVVVMANAMGKTDSEIDELFQLASSL